MTAEDRPPETDTARVQWLLGDQEPVGLFYEMPEGEGSGVPPTRTAVGAPADEPYDQIEAVLRFIDGLRGSERRSLMARLRERYGLDS